MSDDQDKQGPSLEPPRLFGRSKKAARSAPAPSDDTPTTVFEADDAPTVVQPVIRAHPAPAEPLVQPLAQPVDEPVDEVDDAPVVLVAPASLPALAPTARTKPAPEPKAPKTPRTPKAEKPPKAPKPVKERARRADRSQVDGRVAAAVSGLLAGLALVLLVRLGMAGCTAVQGTDSCGAGPGMVLLALVFALGVVAGRFALEFFGVPDPGSTSFLAVGLTGVIALLFLVDVLDTWPMLIVIPVITALTMLLSWFVTTTFIEPADR